MTAKDENEGSKSHIDQKNEVSALCQVSWVRSESSNQRHHNEEVVAEFVPDIEEQFIEDWKAIDDSKIPTTAASEHDKYHCLECDRTFRSAKSLYGHMRSHPYRSYRGVKKRVELLCKANNAAPNHSRSKLKPKQPLNICPSGAKLLPDCSPSTKQPRNSSSSKALRVWNWAVKEDRGKPAITEKEEIHIAAETLRGMSLKKLDERTAAELEMLKAENPFEARMSQNTLDEKISKAHDATSFKPPSGKNSPVIESKLHNCTICDRSFSTYQALGGHIASHKKPKKNSKTDVSERAGVGHLCKKCELSFLTGQALGGHMRRHYRPPDQSTEMPPPEEGVRCGFHDPNVFNLNESPPESEEENHDGRFM